MFDDKIVEEFAEWKHANPDNFSWWNYLNLKSDLDTALAFSKLYCPEIICVDGCAFLKDRYDENIYLEWKSEIENDYTTIEKMVNLYSLEDIFQINSDTSDFFEEKIQAFGNILQFFWELTFEKKYPEMKLKVLISKEADETLITVYQQR
jgi:hypothetical protein